MQILSLRVRNHRSFHDGFAFELNRSTFKTNLPAEGETWSDAIYPVAAIYGANASGKTAVMRSLQYISIALRRSSAEWLRNGSIRRDPFKLSSVAKDDPSYYSLEFVLSGINWKGDGNLQPLRYRYEFEIGLSGVSYECLEVFFSNRSTALFRRECSDKEDHIVFSKYAGPAFDVAQNELILSRAVQLGRTHLSAVSKGIINGVEYYGTSDAEKEERLARITRDLFEGDANLDDLIVLAEIADVGIIDARRVEEDLPPHVVKLLERLERITQDDDEKCDGEDGASLDRDKDSQRARQSKAVQRSLRFIHQSEDASAAELILEDESDGTLAWLAIGMAMLKSLREGTVLVVDELDTSLHPHLATAILEIYEDPEINTKGAQLIFTTHETSFLARMSPWKFEHGQVWFVQKNNRGVSELYSLADFKHLRNNSNIEKQLTEGRLGAVPKLAPAMIASILHTHDEMTGE